LKSLQHFQWGQIEQKENGVQVKWRPGIEAMPLPQEVWEAVRTYLSDSDRLEKIRDLSYIFPPLLPSVTNSDVRREDWDESKSISNAQLLEILGLYGRAVFIDEDKLNMHVLLNTALRLKLDEGADVDEMRSFMGSQAPVKAVRWRLKHLPPLPVDQAMDAETDSDVSIRKRKGGQIQHGYFAKNLPEEEVQTVLGENVDGLEEELVCMRRLARGLIAAQKMTTDHKELAELLDGYSLAATRIAGLIDAEKELEETPTEPEWLEGHLKMFDGMRARMGKEPLSDKLREMFEGVSCQPAETDRQLEEEIAALRFILRNIYIQATQTLEEGHIRHYANLVTMYGKSCNRLIGLLKKRLAGGSALADYVWQTWEESKQIWLESKGWGGEDPINNPQSPVVYVDGEIRE